MNVKVKGGEALDIILLRADIFNEIGFKKYVVFAVFQGWSEFNGGKSHQENVKSQLYQPQRCPGWCTSYLCGQSFFKGCK